jgi:hypothetical protein
MTKSGRQLSESPFFTDGRYFYVVSRNQDKDENDDEEEPAQTKLIVESFDPNTPDFKHVKSVCLYKNKD